ncbi:baseplate assembly protein [Vreelandella neptunia]|uniref:Baseplate J/gp47 family protein n=1 Tax=Vreelandella neptunia TaxID=115551 RepID=A0ABZ0YKB1_9GAMM|nr:baseplate J/gp47 family protein [Halomonas neptunia]MDN3562114.1 baseplate J/gp47 family protein [Halomonas neptunia]WQH11816.1 baseplate J/gp47 family protein [Halomonas neptunia]
MSSPIDLSRLPAPSVIEPLDYETILAELTADLTDRDPELAETLSLESEPLTKLLEVAAYRELLLRQRINEAAKAVMLAYAGGSDLEHLGALLEVERLTIDTGDPSAIPPVPSTLEKDEELRRRIQLSLDGLSTAGPAQAYVFHALSADGNIKDASVTSPSPGEVVVTVLSRASDGSAMPELIQAVETAISADDVRPLTDQVSVQAAEIVTYTIQATLYTYPGPDATVVREDALANAQTYADDQHRLGRDITLSGVYAALHRPGIQRVELESPAATITVTSQQAAYCTAITLAEGGTDV